MSLHLHTDYYQDTLEVRYCPACLKRFIVGEELATTVPQIVCPYCGSTSSEAVVWNSENMGCAGIYFRKTDDRYYRRCVQCGCELTPENAAHENVCLSCHEQGKRHDV